MHKRPAGIFFSGLIVLVAGFAHLRPLLRGALEMLLPSTTRWLILLALSIALLTEVILLLQLRLRAIHIAVALCFLWIAVILVRVTIALQYSPAVFGPVPGGWKAYLAPAIAAAVSMLNIAYLCRPSFRAESAQYRKERDNYERDLEKRLLQRL